MKSNSFLNAVAYFAVALIAVSSVLAKLLGWLINDSVIGVLMLVAQSIAYIITAVYGFFYARSKKTIGWMVAYIIFLVLIIVFTGLNFSSIMAGFKK
ncbi:MAG: hypothetical protein IKA36_02595 [Clostridia bacterium]|nr:hypothetical protein [Clostridia bacterium]